MNYYKIKIKKEFEIYGLPGIYFHKTDKFYFAAKTMVSAINCVQTILKSDQCIVYVKVVDKLPRNVQVFIHENELKNA